MPWRVEARTIFASRGLAKGLLSALVALAVALVLFARIGDAVPYQVDDAYITFRYAANVARGFGPVFNRGERVEGVSNLVWVIALAPFAIARGEPVLPLLLVARGLNVLFLLGSAWAIFRALSRATGSRAAGVLGAVLLPAHESYAMWILPGLETIAYATALLFLATSIADEYARPSSSDLPSPPTSRDRAASILASTVFFLLPGIRPEAGMVAMFVVAGAFPAFLASGRGRALFRFALPVLAGGVCVCAFRLAFYGDLLPNTFYAKVDAVYAERSRLSHLAEIANRHAASLFLATFGAGVVAFGLLRARGSRSSPEPRFALGSAALGGIVGVLAFIWIAGRDWMLFCRYFVPAAPMVCLLAGIGAARAGEFLSERAGTKSVVLHEAFVALPLLVALFFQLAERHPAEEGIARVQTTFVQEMLAAGDAVRAVVPRGATIAIAAAGALPYRVPESPFLDMLGLNDRHIAKHGSRIKDFWWEKTDEDYILSREPDFIVIPYRDDPATGARGPREGTCWSRLYAHPAFKRDYALFRTFAEPSVEPFWLFRRRAEGAWISTKRSLAAGGPKPARGAGGRLEWLGV